MRSLFHFPFPAQPPSQQPSPTATVSLQSEMCHRPHPAPRAPAMPRRRPCLAPLPAPIAPHHLSTAPLPPAPIGLASSASRPPHAVARIASTPLRAAIRIPLCRHRADPALIAPHHDHRAPPSYTCCASPSASRPPCAAARVTPISLLALRRPQGPGWQEPRRMHPFFAECAKKAPFLAASARNACFSRSRWQHPRPMHPFPGAIGRFGMHGTRILPPRALFRVEEPEITHGAKILPAPPGLSATAACGPAERALRHATATCGPTERALRHAAAACGTRHGRTGLAPCGAGLACLPHAPPCHLARVHRRRLTRVALRRPHRAHARRHPPRRPLRSG